MSDIKTRPKYYVIESLDGGGKTTAVDHIYETLKQQDIPVEIVRTIGHDITSNKLREIIIQDDIGLDERLYLISYCHASAYYKIQNLLDKGITVIQDRSIGSFWNLNYIQETDDQRKFLALNLYNTIMKFHYVIPHVEIFIKTEPYITKARIELRANNNKYDVFSLSEMVSQNFEYENYINSVSKSFEKVIITNNEDLDSFKQKLNSLFFNSLI